MTPIHIALIAPSKRAVHKFYEEAMQGGAKDNGAPGPRPDYGANYYASFIFDADGNNVEVVYYGE